MVYVFEDYILDTQRRELRHAGVPVRIERKVYQILAYLVQHHNRLVTKDELLAQVWPGVHQSKRMWILIWFVHISAGLTTSTNTLR